MGLLSLGCVIPIINMLKWGYGKGGIKLKKIIGWSVITGVFVVGLGAGALLLTEKEQVPEVRNSEAIVEEPSIQEDLVSTNSDENNLDKEKIELEDEEYTPFPAQETPEERERRVLREAELREKYSKEKGAFAHVRSLEGDNSYVDGVIRNVDHFINYGKVEEETIQFMHLMTHQKIQAAAKYGAAPLTPVTVAKLVEVLENHPEYDPELLKIAKRWAANDFSEIDHQHNYLNTRLGGVVDEGHAIGVATSEEEKEFILKYFDESVAQDLGFQ